MPEPVSPGEPIDPEKHFTADWFNDTLKLPPEHEGESTRYPDPLFYRAKFQEDSQAPDSTLGKVYTLKNVEYVGQFDIEDYLSIAIDLEKDDWCYVILQEGDYVVMQAPCDIVSE